MTGIKVSVVSDGNSANAVATAWLYNTYEDPAKQEGLFRLRRPVRICGAAMN